MSIFWVDDNFFRGGSSSWCTSSRLNPISMIWCHFSARKNITVSHCNPTLVLSFSRTYSPPYTPRSQTYLLGTSLSHTSDIPQVLANPHQIYWSFRNELCYSTPFQCCFWSGHWSPSLSESIARKDFLDRNVSWFHPSNRVRCPRRVERKPSFPIPFFHARIFQGVRWICFGWKIRLRL